MSGSSVRVRGLIAGYGATRVLDGLDLDVAPSTLVAVLGESGSGKTTLLRALAGFLRPEAGTIELGAVLVSGGQAWVPPERRRIGIVPQEGALFPHLDVRGNVGFGLRRAPDREARIDAMLSLVGMAGSGDARPQELSGGQQQRIALARALAPDPQLVLLDEPYSALDAGLRTELRAEVRELLRAAGTTAILVTHDQEEALAIADAVAVMRDGQLAQVAAPGEVYAMPADLGVARFIGDLVELPVLEARDGRIVTVLGEHEGDARVGDIAVLRPEQLEVHTDGPGAGGRIVMRSYHGHDSLLEVVLEDGTRVAVRVAGEPRVSVGDDVRVRARGSVGAVRTFRR